MMSPFDWIVAGFAGVALGVPLVMAWMSGWVRWLALALLIDGIALSWWMLPLPWSGWLLAYAWLAGFAMFIWSMVNIHAATAAVVGLAWLSLPLWTPAGGGWTHVHPLLSLNILVGLPPWLEQPLPYALTRLGSDFSYDVRPGGWAFTAQMFAGCLLTLAKWNWVRFSKIRHPGPTPPR